MKIDNLEILNGLIAGAEGGTVEFKETTGQLERGRMRKPEHATRFRFPAEADNSFRYNAEKLLPIRKKPFGSTRQADRRMANLSK